MPKLSVFQTILLSAFGALAVSGVLIFALVIGSGSGTNIGPVMIWGTFDENTFRKIIRESAEQDGRLLSVTYEQKDEDKFADLLTEALASGTGPDIFILRQENAVRDAGKVFPIPYDGFSETQFRNTFIEAANPYLGEAGVLGIPLLADPLVLYWNRDMLASAGFASPPRYWDELSGMAQSITKRNEAGQVQKSAISFGEYRNVSHAKEIVSTLILQAGGLITTRDSIGRLVSVFTPRQAIESALRFYTEFADPSKAIYSWSRAMPESRSAFASGDLALYIGFASEYGAVARMNPNLNFAVASIPQIRSAERTLTFARVYALSVARTTRNPSGAVQVASLLASADTSSALSNAYGIPSARRDVLTQTTPAASNDDLFKKQAIASGSWTDPDPAKTDDVFRGMIENVTTGTMRLSEAVARAHQEIGHILEL